jgi:two-component system sensor histidine kinase KdpD
MKTPEEILIEIQSADKKNNRGKLKIFFGMCAGVGKTYSMLLHARDLNKSNYKILVGYIETHGRQETAELLAGFEIIPRKKIIYKDIEFEEFDLEKTLELKPDLVLVDELAHTNLPGMKHNKRYQDIEELLENGINVFTTVNVQHIESRSRTVEYITGIPIHETVPDSIIELADDIELIDLPIEELLRRLNEGKVYLPDKAKLASKNFFKTGNLISLREMALRLTAEKVESDLVDYMSEKNIDGPWKSGDKLLVAVGSSPFSAELIRWTRRIAYSLKTKWFAVYVRTDNINNGKNNTQLEKNLRLAKDLGAEVITTANTDLVDGLLEIARKNNVTQIIIGKPAKYNILNYIRKDNYIDRLIIESGNIDIYIVRPNKIKSAEVKKVKTLKLQSKAKEYFYSLISIVLLSALCFPVRDYLGYQTVGLILLLNLIILPFYVGRGPIIIGALLNSIIWNFFFIPPLFTFEISKLHDVMTLILNFVVALSSGFLATKIRKQQELVKIREKNTLALLDYTKDLAVAKTKYDVIQTTLNHIDKNIDANATFFNVELQPVASSRAFWNLSEKENSIAKWSLENNHISGKFTDNLPDSICQYIPIVKKDVKIGVLGLYLSSKLSIESENLINNYLTQMTGIYEKEESREMLQKMELEKQSQKLYDTLIDSISHEFRTPIAVISGASSVLFDKKVIENHEVVSELVKEIYSASQRIDLLVENLLDINRLETGQIKLKKSVCSINEIIFDITNQLNKDKGKREIKLNLDVSNPLLLIDDGFIRQAFFNILFNACIHTPDNSTIIVTTQKLTDKCVIEIKDNGKGVPPEHLAKLFEKFYRVPNSKTGGTGLGLSIAKGFIEAHKGKIYAANNIPSGIIFVITLPYEK